MIHLLGCIAEECPQGSVKWLRELSQVFLAQIQSVHEKVRETCASGLALLAKNNKSQPRAIYEG